MNLLICVEKEVVALLLMRHLISANRSYGNNPEKCVSDSPSSFALRETRKLFANPRVVLGLLAVCVVLALAGAFGTDRYMRLVPRLAYWAVVGPSTFALGSLVAAALQFRFAAHRNAMWLVPILIGLAVGLSVSLLLIAINWAALGAVPDNMSYLTQLVTNTMAVAAIIAIALHFLGAPEPAAAEANQVPLLDRMDLNKRGALVSISVQDHYVEVVTTTGRNLILLRLSDAIRETGTTPGLQVHRSHWVATDQVRSASRKGERAILTMSSGDEIPVSRTYVKAIRNAGLLPA